MSGVIFFSWNSASIRHFFNAELKALETVFDEVVVVDRRYKPKPEISNLWRYFILFICRILLRLFNALGYKKRARYFQELCVDLSWSMFGFEKASLIYFDKPNFPFTVRSLRKRKDLLLITFQAMPNNLKVLSVLKGLVEVDSISVDSKFLNASLSRRRAKSLGSFDFIIAHSNLVQMSNHGFLTNYGSINFGIWYGCILQELKPVVKKSHGTFRVVTVATDYLLKGINLIECVAAELRGLVEFDIIGINSKRIISNINYLGYIDSKEIEEIFVNSDLYLQASYIDAGPKAIFEALANGLPCAVSSGCGLSEVFDHRINGYIFNPNIKEMVVLLKNLALEGIPKHIFEGTDKLRKSYTFDNQVKILVDIFKNTSEQHTK